MAGGSTTDSLDPATMTDAMAYNINWQVRNCLVEVDYKGNPIPELAESWESSPDAVKWVFKLRKGVEFHNGKTLNADGCHRFHQLASRQRIQVGRQGYC